MGVCRGFGLRTAELALMCGSGQARERARLPAQARSEPLVPEFYSYGIG